MWLKTDDSWTGRDKAQHLVGGGILGVAISFVLLVQPMDVLPWHIWVYTVFLTGVVALFKERWDLRHPPHVASLQDALVIVAGGAVGSLIGLFLTTLVVHK